MENLTTLKRIMEHEASLKQSVMNLSIKLRKDIEANNVSLTTDDIVENQVLMSQLVSSLGKVVNTLNEAWLDDIQSKVNNKYVDVAQENKKYFLAQAKAYLFESQVRFEILNRIIDIQLGIISGEQKEEIAG